MSTAAISLSPSGSFRAASLKQVWIDRLMTGRARVWNALLAYGQLRAEAEVLRTARQCQASRPELARALRRVANDLAPPAEPYPGPGFDAPAPQEITMTAITSKTFQYAPTMGLPVGVRQVAEALTAGGLLLARLLTTSAPIARRSRAVEAEEVRVMARGWEKTDPGFAADLYAAAARHEGLDD